MFIKKIVYNYAFFATATDEIKHLHLHFGTVGQETLWSNDLDDFVFELLLCSKTTQTNMSMTYLNFFSVQKQCKLNMSMT